MMRPAATLLLSLVFFSQAASAQESEPESATLAALVEGVPILVREVERELAKVVKDREVVPSVRRALLAKTLQQLVDRQLVLTWLREKGRGASEQDVDLALSRLARIIQQRGSTMAGYRKQQDLDEDGLRRVIEWQIGWRQYLERHLVAANLRRYFDDHRRDFDGTRMRVAHILLPVAPPHGEVQQQAAINAAKRIRQRIVTQEITFARAAQEHSTAPTGAQGGDIGLIARREPMPEPFSEAAFSLEQGAVSDPVVTSFGVHLIHCLEIQPGQLAWQDARDDLEQAVTRYLFEWAADQARQGATVEFTGASPYFRPGSEDVVEGPREP